jgi:tRNA threonylcarbamoyladenosine biosynthesis protein TsaB
MKILALEFSSAQRSVAVVRAALRGDGLSATESDAVSNRTGTHATHFSTVMVSEVVETGSGAKDALGMIDEALRTAKVDREQIERVAVGIGPGSYTGIRAAIALAQGWQLARGVQLLGISSAGCLALQALAGGLIGRVNVVINAQRDEFYMAGYEIRPGGMGAECCLEVEPLRLTPLAEVREHEHAGEVLIGPEVTRWFPHARIIFPSAAMLAEMAINRNDFVPGEKIEPIYLRETSFVKAPPPRLAP